MRRRPTTSRAYAALRSSPIARSIAAGSGQRMAARSKVGQAAIRDSPAILWPPRRSALRICSGRLIAAATASAIMSAARRSLISGLALIIPLSAGQGVRPLAKRPQDVLALDGVEYAVAQHAGVFGFGDQKLDRIVAPTLAAAFNALLG